MCKLEKGREKLNKRLKLIITISFHPISNMHQRFIDCPRIPLHQFQIISYSNLVKFKHSGIGKKRIKNTN